MSTKKQTLFGGDEYVIDGNDPICNLMIDYEERIDALKEYEDNESFSVAMTEFQLMYNTYENIMNNHEIFVVLEAFRDERGIDYCQFLHNYRLAFKTSMETWNAFWLYLLSLPCRVYIR